MQSVVFLILGYCSFSLSLSNHVFPRQIVSPWANVSSTFVSTSSTTANPTTAVHALVSPAKSASTTITSQITPTSSARAVLDPSDALPATNLSILVSSSSTEPLYGSRTNSFDRSTISTTSNSGTPGVLLSFAPLEKSAIATSTQSNPLFSSSRASLDAPDIKSNISAAQFDMSISPSTTAAPALYNPPVNSSSSSSQSGNTSLNSTLPVITSSNSSTCQLNCQKQYPRITTYIWTATNKPKDDGIPRATITGTVKILIDSLTNQTQRITVLGAQTLKGFSAIKSMTFPDPYVDYTSKYTIPAFDLNTPAALSTKGGCTQSDDPLTFTLPDHPLLPQATAAPFSLAQNQVYAIATFLGPLNENPNGFFEAKFPDESGLQKCEPAPPVTTKPGEVLGPGPAALTAVLVLTTPPPSTITLPSTTTISSTNTPSNTQATETPFNTPSIQLFPSIDLKSILTQSTNTIVSQIQSDTPPALQSASPTDTLKVTQTTEPPSRDSTSHILPDETTKIGGGVIATEVPEATPAPLPTPVNRGFSLGSETIIVRDPISTEMTPGSPVAAPGVVLSGTSHKFGETFTLSETPVAVISSSSKTFVVVGSGPTASTVPLLPVATKQLASPLDNRPPSPTFPALIASSQTLTLGGSITLGSGPSQTIVKLLTDGSGDTLIIAGGETATLAGPVKGLGSTIPTSVIQVGGINFTPSAQPVITINSAGETVVISNGITATLTDPVALAKSSTLAAIAIGGTIITPTILPSSAGLAFVVSGQTLTLGGSVTIGTGTSSTVLSLTIDAAGQTILVSNGHTSVVDKQSVSVTPVALTIDGTTISATKLPSGSQGFVVNGQALTVGGSATITKSGTITVLTLTTDAGGKTVLVSNGQTSIISNQNPVSIGAVLTIDGSAITANSLPAGGSGFIVDGQMLTIGGSVTITHSGTSTVLSLTTDASGHSVLVSNGHTSTVQNQMASLTLGLLTIDGTVYTATHLPTGGLGYIIAGQTLTMGASATITHGSSINVYTLTTEQSGHTILVSNGMTSTVPDDTTFVTSTAVPPRITPLGTARQTSATKSTASRIGSEDRGCFAILFSSFAFILVSCVII